MNLAIPFLVGVLALSAISSEAAPPVRLQLNSFSVLFRPAIFKDRFIGVDYLNQVTSAGDNPPNGELEFTADPNIPATHQGTFVYQDGITFETFDLPFILDLPSDDNDDDGLPDIIEFTPGVSDGISLGQYFDLEGTVHSFNALWNKNASSYTGTCRFTISPEGSPQTFTHPIEIYEYTASLPIDANASTGEKTITVDMPRSGVAGEKITGNLTLKFEQGKVSALAKSALQNETGASFVLNSDSASDLNSRILYCFLDVLDGTPTTDSSVVNYEDFNEWMLMIIDPSDTDADGVPNIVDSGATTAGAPRLEIIKTGNGIQLLVHGDIGRAYTLEDASALPATAWSHPTTVTISTDPQVIDLPAPTSPIFWRARFP